MFVVDGRALCGRGGRTLLGCRSEVVLYTPIVIIASRRHMDLAMVHTHSDSRAATFRDRKRTSVPTRSLTPHHSTKQYNKRHVAIEAQAKTLLEEAQ